MDLFKIGQITAPVGIRGEIRVYPYTEEMTRFSAVKTLLIEGEKEPRGVEKFRQDKNLVVIKLSGIDDRNTSELLRGKNLFVDKKDFCLDDNSYYTEDLIGMNVIDDKGNSVGLLKSINANPAHDLYEIEKPDGGSFMLPAVKQFILSVDTENKQITVHLIDGISDL